MERIKSLNKNNVSNWSDITELVQGDYEYLHKKTNKWLSLLKIHLRELKDLEKLFSNYVVLNRCYLFFDRLTGRKRGFAFTDLSDNNSKKRYW